MKSTILALFALAAAPLRAAAPVGPNPAPLPPQLDLQSAILYALDHNYPILQAREQLRQQEGVIMQVKAQSIPNLNATGQYERNKPSISQSYPPSNSNWAVQVKATQVIFAGGGVQSAIKNAELIREAALFDLQTTINAALLEVRTRFYNVLLTREKVRVQEENIELFRHQLLDTQNQLHAGAVSNFEVLRAKVALANVQPDLITARNDHRIAIEQLRQSLGVPAGTNGPNAFPDVVGTLDTVPESVALETALASAQAHRPELLRLAKVQEAGQQAVVSARSTYYPNLSAFGAYQWDAFSFNGLGQTTANGWQVGVQSSWSIFDGRATAGKVRQARSLLEQERLSTESEELGIDVEVRQAVSTLQEAGELLDATKETVNQAAEAVRQANERYHVGSTTQLDVQTIQLALTQARTNQLQANYNYLVAVAGMRRAEGLADASVTR